jgi:hypothetical protein
MLQGTPQQRRYHFDDGNSIQQAADGIAACREADAR